jgi:RNA polymerase sigma-70 factor (ECF subfamily)
VGDDDEGVDGMSAPADDAGTALLALYGPALPQVYGYLLRRCGRREVAEDLTSETFLAAVDSVRRAPPPRMDVAWLIGVARHKLADHWRRQAREQRNLRAVADVDAGNSSNPDVDPWDARLDALQARDTLARLAPQHRAALTLRYVDDLPVAQIAALLDRTIHATEALLVRARREFRSIYVGEGETDD